MAVHKKTLEAEAVIVGSGPGGATVARELARRGKRVVLCEAGRLHHRFCHTLSLFGMMEGFGLTFSREGTWVIRPKTVGGASVVFRKRIYQDLRDSLPSKRNDPDRACAG